MIDKNAERLRDLVSKEAFHWGENVAVEYHGQALNDMDEQWKSIIWPLLSKYEVDFSETIDFACGYGRNARKLKAAGAGVVTLVDVNEDNIRYCENLLVEDPTGYRIVRNNGYDLSNLGEGAFSLIYTYDAMVHFDFELIIAYVTEFSRILRVGATAFVHHSNFTANAGGDFTSNPHWRNFMSAGIFRHIASKRGFEVLEQRILAWGGVPDLDCISIMRKL